MQKLVQTIHFQGLAQEEVLYQYFTVLKLEALATPHCETVTDTNTLTKLTTTKTQNITSSRKTK